MKKGEKAPGKVVTYMDEMDILESGLHLVKRVEKLLDNEEYSFLYTQRSDYMIRARLAVVLVMRWMEKYVSDFRISMYNMLEGQKNGVNPVETISYDLDEAIAETSEMMETVEQIFVDISPSWMKYVYAGISEAALQCLESAQSINEEENRPVEDAWFAGRVAFVQMFREGPLKDEQDTYRNFLEQLYEEAADREMYETGNICYWYLTITENKMIPKLRQMTESISPLSNREKHLLKDLLDDLIVPDDPFHSATVSDLLDISQGLQENGKLEYIWLSCRDSSMDVYSDPYQYCPHKGLEMYLLDRMTGYLKRKYPNLAQSWQ